MTEEVNKVESGAMQGKRMVLRTENLVKKYGKRADTTNI